MELLFKRLGHLGEIHLAEPEGSETLCGMPANGPNFREVTPVDLEPRPDPTLCADCKTEMDNRSKEDEPEEETSEA